MTRYFMISLTDFLNRKVDIHLHVQLVKSYFCILCHLYNRGQHSLTEKREMSTT